MENPPHTHIDARFEVVTKAKESFKDGAADRQLEVQCVRDAGTGVSYDIRMDGQTIASFTITNGLHHYLGAIVAEATNKADRARGIMLNAVAAVKRGG